MRAQKGRGDRRTKHAPGLIEGREYGSGMAPPPAAGTSSDRSQEVWSHADDVARLARQLCQHREDAEDVAQSALLKAALHLDGFRGESSVLTWLHRITANECRMIRRRITARSLDAILERPGASVPGPSRGARPTRSRLPRSAS